MEIGESRVTNGVLRMLDEDTRNQVDSYINDVCLRDFIIMSSVEQINEVFKESLNTFLESVTYEELMNLRSYTGYNFKNINAILRNNWTYENNGVLNSFVSEKYRKLSMEIGNVINKFVMPDINFITFRGTTIGSFSSYGITELHQLKNLEGKFLYEQGFTSTSILESTSYFNKQLDDGRFCNIGIRYLIPSESDDGILLTSNEISYSMNQNEFLINKGSLSKVIDVKIDEKTNSATLTVLLVPKKIYDMGKVNDNGKNR